MSSGGGVPGELASSVALSPRGYRTFSVWVCWGQPLYVRLGPLPTVGPNPQSDSPAMYDSAPKFRRRRYEL